MNKELDTATLDLVDSSAESAISRFNHRMLFDYESRDCGLTPLTLLTLFRLFLFCEKGKKEREKTICEWPSVPSGPSAFSQLCGVVFLDRTSEQKYKTQNFSSSSSSNGTEGNLTREGSMKRCLIAVCVSLAVCSMVVQAQQAPRPGPEHKRLGVFLGSWSIDGEYKPGNGYGATAGKVNTVERYQWLPGEFFLQMNRDGKAPVGDIKHMIIFGYDTAAKKYSGAFFDFMTGGTTSATLNNIGNTWIWSGNGHAPDGKAYQERCTVMVIPNASYTVKCETSADGKSWSPSYEAKATKSKS